MLGKLQKNKIIKSGKTRDMSSAHDKKQATEEKHKSRSRLANSQYSKRQKLILTATLSAVILLFIGASLYLGKKNYTTGYKLCSDNNFLSKASAVLEPDKIDQLKSIVERIQLSADYEKSADCLNIVTTYFINTADKDNAKTYFEKLEKIYDPNKGFSPSLGSNAPTMDFLRDNIKLLEKKSEEYEQNKFYGPEI